MSKVLRCNLTLRQDMNSYPVSFKAGEELPEEFHHLVGEHVFGGKPRVKAPEQKTSSAKAKSKPEPKKAPAPKKDTPPSEGGSKASWLAFAKSKGVTVPDDAGRDDIIELVYNKFPELKD